MQAELKTSTPLKGSIQLPVLIGYFAIIDLLFLPYFQILIIPLSLPAIAWSFIVFKTRIKLDFNLRVFICISLLATASTLLSIFLKDSSPYLAENFKRLFQLLSSFLYFYYFRWLAKTYTIDIKPILYIFIIWFCSLSIAFFISPESTQNLLQSLYGRLVMKDEKALVFLRFAYLFSDPNAAAYFFLIALAPLLYARTISVKQTALLALALIPILISQSRGAFLAYSLVIIFTIFPPKSFFSSILNPKKLIISSLILLTASTALFITIQQSSDPFVDLILKRLFQDEQSLSTGGSRFSIWAFYSSRLEALPLGRGFQFNVENDGFYPHSDLMRLTYSYGSIAAIALTTFLFNRIKSYPQLIIPAVAAFSINTLIDDQKIVALYLSLLALSPHLSNQECQTTKIRKSRWTKAIA